MKVTISHDSYDTVYGLGVSLWLPRHTTWKRFSITFTFGPFCTDITFGSKTQFEAELKRLRSGL